MEGVTRGAGRRSPERGLFGTVARGAVLDSGNEEILALFGMAAVMALRARHGGVPGMIELGLRQKTYAHAHRQHVLLLLVVEDVAIRAAALLVVDQRQRVGGLAR